jgi:hypothetical protein
MLRWLRNGDRRKTPICRPRSKREINRSIGEELQYRRKPQQEQLKAAYQKGTPPDKTQGIRDQNFGGKHRMQIGISALMVVHREKSVVLSGGRGIPKKREQSMQMPGFARHTTIFYGFYCNSCPCGSTNKNIFLKIIGIREDVMHEIPACDVFY